MRAIANISWDK